MDGSFKNERIDYLIRDEKVISVYIQNRESPVILEFKDETEALSEFNRLIDILKNSMSILRNIQDVKE